MKCWQVLRPHANKVRCVLNKAPGKVYGTKRSWVKWVFPRCFFNWNMNKGLNIHDFRRHISLRDCCRTSFLFCLLSGNYFGSLRIHEKSCCVNITYLQFNEQIPKLMPCLTQRGYIRKRQHGTCATNTPQKFSIASQNSKDRKNMHFNWNHDFWEIHSWECLGKSSLFFVDWLILGERPTKFGGNVNWSQTHTRRL